MIPEKLSLTIMHVKHIRLNTKILYHLDILFGRSLLHLGHSIVILREIKKETSFYNQRILGFRKKVEGSRRFKKTYLITILCQNQSDMNQSSFQKSSINESQAL